MMRCDQAEAEVIGMLLILMLTILSVGVITVVSVPTLLDIQDMANAERVQQAFTVLDSRTSKAGLGESPQQVTYVELGGGTIYVNDNDSMSNMRIWTESGLDFTCGIGSIVYENNGYEVAYEGGGVWAKYPTGDAVMISPPEFHYNGVTLTLPLMNVSGNSMAGGKGNAIISVSTDNQPGILYPSPQNGLNPVNATEYDRIHVTIRSEYYKAWADYADSQAYVSSTVFDNNKTTELLLEVVSPQGTDLIGSSFKVGKLNQSASDPVYNFSFRLEARDNQGLHPYTWYVTATSGTKTLEYTLHESAGVIHVELEYTDTSVGSTDYIEYWDSGSDGFTIYGSGEDEYSDVDLLSDTLDLDYEVGGAKRANPDFSWEDPATDIACLPGLVIDGSNPNSTQSLNNLTQHYLKLMTRDGPVTFDVTSPGQSDPVDYTVSTITLEYDGMPGALTYLHVTENRLNVRVE